MKEAPQQKNEVSKVSKGKYLMTLLSSKNYVWSFNTLPLTLASRPLLLNWLQ